MFDFLKGGKAKVTVETDRPNQPYVPGERINAQVTVQGEKDLKIQKGKVALIYREEYQRQYRDSDTDSDGSTSTTDRKSWQTDEIEQWQEQFFGETTVKGGSNQTFEYSIPLPYNAPPTLVGGKILKGQWVIKATLDRKLASDVEAKVESFVVTVPTGKSGGAGTYGMSNAPDEAQLALNLPGEEFVLGDTITGEFVIQPRKEFDASEFRVEVVCSEDVPEDLGNTNTTNISVKVSGGAKLLPGQDLKFPFQLTIPGNAPVTCKTRHGSVTWTLRGVIARRMRSDTYVEHEILVYSTRPG